jgi:hypothetical protein
MYEDRQGILWVGTAGALNRIDRKAGQYTAYRISGPGFDTDVLAINEDDSGALWISTISHGFKRFDRRTGQFLDRRDNPTGVSSSTEVVLRISRPHRCAVGLELTDLAIRSVDGALDRLQTSPRQIVNAAVPSMPKLW